MEVKLSPGDSFGHMFPEHAPSSIRCRSDCVLWELDRNVYMDVNKFYRERVQADALQFLKKSVPLVKGVDEEWLQEIAEELEKVHCQKGQIHAPATGADNYFYFIYQGTVAVLDEQSVTTEAEQRRSTG